MFIYRPSPGYIEFKEEAEKKIEIVRQEAEKMTFPENVQLGEVYRFKVMVTIPAMYRSNYLEIIRDELEMESHGNYEIVEIKDFGFLRESEVGLWIDLRVTKNPLPFLVVFGILVAGISFLFLTFNITLKSVDRITERIIEKPVGAALSIGTLLIAGILIWKLLL